jgi:hypothetical protein
VPGSYLSWDTIILIKVFLLFHKLSRQVPGYWLPVAMTASIHVISNSSYRYLILYSQLLTVVKQVANKEINSSQKCIWPGNPTLCSYHPENGNLCLVSVFYVDKEAHAVQHNKLRGMLKPAPDHGNIPCSVTVSEPLEEESSIKDCKEVG